MDKPRIIEAFLFKGGWHLGLVIAKGKRGLEVMLLGTLKVQRVREIDVREHGLSMDDLRLALLKAGVRLHGKRRRWKVVYNNIQAAYEWRGDGNTK